MAAIAGQDDILTETEQGPDPDAPTTEPLSPIAASPIEDAPKLGTCKKTIALILMCLLGFGNYFCFDNPGALQNEIKETMHVSTFEFANLYAFYSWPNVFFPVLGGYLIDTLFGLRFGASFFACLLIVGQAMVSAGAFVDSYVTMEIGRFVFGLGGESLAVAQNTYATHWFSGNALNMVFGLQLSIARLGSTVNFQSVGPLFHKLTGLTGDMNEALGWTLAISGSSLVMSFICSLFLAWMDGHRLDVINALEEDGKKKEDEAVHFSELFKLPGKFWVLCVICVSYYVAVFPFVSLGQVFFMRKYEMDHVDANFINGLVYLISAFASPAFGVLIDRTGRNVSYVYGAVTASLISHCLLALTFVNPYVPIIILGLAYSLLASALWPMCTYIVSSDQLGTAFGFMQAIQNLGLAVIAMLSGLIVDEEGYLWLEIFFISWLSVALAMTLWLWVWDYRTNGVLNMSVTKRREYEAQQAFLQEQNKLNSENTTISSDSEDYDHK